jgi:hypothetical protein
VLIDLSDGTVRGVSAGRSDQAAPTLLRVGATTWRLVRTEGRPDLLLQFGG